MLLHKVGVARPTQNAVAVVVRRNLMLEGRATVHHSAGAAAFL